MSRYYTYEVEGNEVIEQFEDTYYIICPKCEHEVEIVNITAMPWGEDDEIDYTCEKCGFEFTVRPKYKFHGFFTYHDYIEEETDAEV